MRRKKEKAKIAPIHQPAKEMSFKERVRKFNQYVNDPESHHKIFSELGFSYVEDGCSGGCETCERSASCETYKEIKEIDF